MARVVYFVPDLLFGSKIRETAKQLGVDTESVRDPSLVVTAAKDAKLVIVDLRSPLAMDMLDRLAADPTTSAVTKVGFVDHERLEVFDAAKSRGCRALAKGAFTNELSKLMGDAK